GPRRKALHERQAAAVKIEAGDVEEVAGIAEEHRHVGADGGCKRLQRRIVYEHRSHAISRILEDAPHDNASFGDEQSLSTQQIGVRDLPVSINPRIASASYPLDRHISIVAQSTPGRPVPSKRPYAPSGPGSE